MSSCHTASSAPSLHRRSFAFIHPPGSRGPNLLAPARQPLTLVRPSRREHALPARADHRRPM